MNCSNVYAEEKSTWDRIITESVYEAENYKVTFSLTEQWEGGYLMQNLANMASGTGPLTGYDTNGIYATAKASFVASSGFIPGGFIGGMTHPHMQPTYYLIAHNNFEPLKDE